MSLHFPDFEMAEYVSHLSPNMAQFQLPSPFELDDKGRPDVLTVLVGMLPCGEWEFACTEAPERCPTWLEMKYIRDLCWDDEDVVMQLHPQASRYVNHSEFALWQWRPLHRPIPQPPLWRETSQGA